MSDYLFASDNDPSAPGENPYQSPEVTSKPNDVGRWDSSLNSAADMLRKTKPWVRFMSVIMFIASAFMALGGAFMMAAGAVGSPGISGAFVGIVYVVMAVLYIIPAVFLWRYADRIGSFLLQRTPVALTHALEAQKSFWKFVGILTLIVICLYALMAIFAVFSAIALTM